VHGEPSGIAILVKISEKKKTRERGEQRLPHYYCYQIDRARSPAGKKTEGEKTQGGKKKKEKVLH